MFKVYKNLENFLVYMYLSQYYLFSLTNFKREIVSTKTFAFILLFKY